MSGLSALAPFVRRAATSLHAGSRCELCGAPVGDPHRHVVERATHTLRCACGACAILFRDAGAGGGRWRTVPDRVLVDGAFQPEEAAWAALELPVRLAFLAHTTDGEGRDAWTAFYPSPGGTVEAPLSEAATRALITLAPLAAEVAPDVEALLVHRRRGGLADCFLAPIDRCYELVALVRRKWQGFDGGDAAWRAIEGYFASLRARSRPFVKGAVGAERGGAR